MQTTLIDPPQTEWLMCVKNLESLIPPPPPEGSIKCAHCDEYFMPRNKLAMFCSVRCRAKAKNRNRAKRKVKK